jgi:tungstate transport system substrate-binding protein
MKLQRNLWITVSLSFVLALLVCPLSFSGKVAPKELRLATTTSTENSGLLDVLLPPFEERYGVKVKVIAVGTGAAIRIAKDGNADVILVHARSLEDEFIAQGYGTKRYQVMHNDFVIAGPAEDPAQIKGEKDVLRALRKIAFSEAGFVSRGDKSGTHIKEMSLWKILEIKPEKSWYIESGSGMASTLRIASEKRAYALSDRGTYLHLQQELDLVILCEGDKRLFNLYGVIPVSPEKYPWVKYDLAMKFVKYITGKEGQEIIAQYGLAEFGEPLFIPNTQEAQ